MNIINIGTYPPKQCGIATFSMDMRDSLMLQSNNVKIISLSDDKHDYIYPEEVLFNIRQNIRSDYWKAAALINDLDHVDLVIIQHEYGIFGGKNGEYILDLAKLLHKPYILITHTVLPAPTKQQKNILYSLCQGSSGIAAMTKKSAAYLTDLYEAPAELVKLIPHGVPEFLAQPQGLLKAKHGVLNREIISTFGLIGPGKGLELALMAMKDITRDYPQVLYLILGQTHPMLKKQEGEKYRYMLEDLVEQANLTPYVKFVNKFLTDEELGEYLYLTDIFLSPYPNLDQAVSGTMAFAIGCGRAIVSTPYAYAKEMLSGGRGLLASQTSPEEISKLVKEVLADDQLKSQLQNKTYALGKNWTWPHVGLIYDEFFRKVLAESPIMEDRTINYAKL